jgi:hypothetical protein
MPRTQFEAGENFRCNGIAIVELVGRGDNVQRVKADKAMLFQHVEFLTTLRPFRNYQNLQSLHDVCQYLAEQLDQYGLQVDEQCFEARGAEYRNICASYKSEKRRRLVVGAHYDVCGDQPGADDNASAVAGLLEVARMVALNRPEIDYRIDFVAYCLEEPPFFGTKQMGSYVHAASIADIRSDVIGLINFEMIGYFHEGQQIYPDDRLRQIYPDTANFIAVVGRNVDHEFNKKVYELMKADAAIDVQLVDHPMVEIPAGMSDQINYWKFDIPALMINDTAFFRNPHYHQMTDDIDTLSFDHMREVVACAYRAVTGF